MGIGKWNRHYKTGKSLIFSAFFFISRNETKDAILRSHTWKDENQHNWLSFFVIPLSCNQTTAKKEENVEYENHTHFKYDSQININHWPTDEKTIRYVQKSS